MQFILFCFLTPRTLLCCLCKKHFKQHWQSPTLDLAPFPLHISVLYTVDIKRIKELDSLFLSLLPFPCSWSWCLCWDFHQQTHARRANPLWSDFCLVLMGPSCISVVYLCEELSLSGDTPPQLSALGKVLNQTHAALLTDTQSAVCLHYSANMLDQVI